MITSLRLFQRYIYHISKTISTLAQIVAVHPEQVLAQQVTMKQVYHTIPSDMPWTVSSGTRDFRSCCEKKMQWSHSCSTWWREDTPVAPVDRLVCWKSKFFCYVLCVSILSVIPPDFCPTISTPHCLPATVEPMKLKTLIGSGRKASRVLVDMRYQCI